MFRSFFLVFLILFIGDIDCNSQNISISSNNRYLQADGKPFFYMGDTAWELFHRLNREEAKEYLENRANKGFNVIQAVVLAELDGLNTPNPYGHLPLTDNDPTKINNDYFEHVDYVVNLAEELGLFIGLLPTWGDKFNKKWGIGPEIFTPHNAKVFGEILGERYQNKPIIWILGGDRNAETEEHKAIIRAMAAGIKIGDNGRHLITYHPMGGSNSSGFFHDDVWLDFNMFQSGHHEQNNPNYEFNIANLKLSPYKPTIDGEPKYEDHPIDWKPENGWFDDTDVRQAAYWSVFSGAMGHTYGNHNIWQMWHPGHEPVSAARTPWKEAMDHPGAYQMGYLRQLMESRPFGKLLPDQFLIMGNPGSGMHHMRAIVSSDKSFAFIYIPTGNKVNVKMSKIGKSKVKTWWYNPRSGEATLIGEYVNMGIREFAPPGDEEKGNDWVLVLDDAARGYEVPGVVVPD